MASVPQSSSRDVLAVSVPSSVQTSLLPSTRGRKPASVEGKYRNLQLSPSLAPTSTPSSLAPTGTPPPSTFDESCNICVNAGCTFCDASSYYARGPNVCVCEGLNDGFYGGCADYSWNSSPKTECEHHVGDRLRKIPLVIWPLIGLVSTLMFCFFWSSCCCTHAGTFLGNPGDSSGFGDMNDSDPRLFCGESNMLSATGENNSVSSNSFSDPEIV